GGGSGHATRETEPRGGPDGTPAKADVDWPVFGLAGPIKRGGAGGLMHAWGGGGGNGMEGRRGPLGGEDGEGRGGGPKFSWHDDALPGSYATLSRSPAVGATSSGRA